MKRISTRVFPKAERVLQGLEQIDQNKLPEGLKAKDLQKMYEEAKKKDDERIEAMARYRKLVDEAAEMRNQLDDLLVRIRSTVKGIFGPDSHEYQLVGGRRSSERRRS